jgi:23S rRNA pseudouridine2457 synthase
MDKKYYLLNKPFNVISQFTKENAEDITLADLNFNFPKDVYSVGRLDKDSEGLLVLTNDNVLKTKLLEPKNEHRKTYLIQVEGIPTPEAVAQLEKGVTIRIDKKDYATLPCKIKVLPEEFTVAPRNPPIRERQNIPTVWLEISLTEGKNRQVRRMCAVVGFPVLRLIRIRIGNVVLHDLAIGEVREVKRSLFN